MKEIQKKRLYSYPLADGRTVLTHCDLSYACDQKGNVDLASVWENDVKSINVIADPTLGFLLSELYGKEWCPPDVVVEMNNRELLDLPFYQHCSVLSKGEIQVFDGKFVSLAEYIKNASKRDMAAMLWNVAIQAALAQLSIVADTADTHDNNV